jgi:hypothetical protein
MKDSGFISYFRILSSSGFFNVYYNIWYSVKKMVPSVVYKWQFTKELSAASLKVQSDF